MKDLMESEKHLKYAQVSALRLAGASISQVAKESGMTNLAIKSLIDSEAYQDYQKSLEEKINKESVNIFKIGVLKLTNDIIDVLKYHIKIKNIEAVKIYLKMTGLEKTETVQQNGNIQVVLPNFNPDSPKVVESDVVIK